jgi:hypothetical protein
MGDNIKRDLRYVGVEKSGLTWLKVGTSAGLL